MNFQNNNNFNNRVYQGQIAEEIAQSMRLYGSNSIPYANSTLRLPMNMAMPTMFGQLQGMVSGAFGPEIGMAMGAFASNPFFQSMLPAGVSSTINTLMSSPPLGGTTDPAAFMMAQLYRNVGRGIPRATLPFDFTNFEATDSYIAQQNAYADYMGTYFGTKVGGTNLQALQFGAEANVGSINQLIAARNAIALSRENVGFGNAFEIMNALDKGIDPNTIYTDAGFNAALKSNSDAQRFLNDPKNKKLIERITNNARMATGVVNTGEYLAQYLGGNAVQNAAAQSIGDFILGDVLQIGNNPQFFQSEVAKTLGNMGVLGTAMGISSTNQNIPAANLIAGRVNEIFNRGDESPFLSTRSMGYNRTRELISALSGNGLISAGGADVYGSMKQGDIDKLGESLMTQLEGFSEIVKVGKRVGLKVDEVVKGMDAIYGGRISQTINSKADSILADFNKVGAGGRTAADLLLDEENARRAAKGAAPLSGASEISEFLRMQAQRQAGKEIGAQIAETINVGQFAGIDARGTLAIANTITRMMENIGVDGGGSLDMTKTALAMVGTSTAAGRPITATQGVGAVTGIIATSMQNPSTKAYLALQLAIKQGAASSDDPAIKDLIAKYQEGEELNDAQVMSVLNKYGVDEKSYMRYRDQGVFDAGSHYKAMESNIVLGKEGPIAKMRIAMTSLMGKAGSDAAFKKIEALGGADGLEGGLLTIRKGLLDGRTNEVRDMLNKQGFNKSEIDSIILEVGARDRSVVGVDNPKVANEIINYFLDSKSIQNRYGLQTMQSALTLRANSDARLSDLMARAAESDTGGSGQKIRESIAEKRKKKVEAFAKAWLEANPNGDPEKALEFAENNVSLGVAELLEIAGGMSSELQDKLLSFAETELNTLVKGSDKTAAQEAKLGLERIAAFRQQRSSAGSTAAKDEEAKIKAEVQDLLNPSTAPSKNATVDPLTDKTASTAPAAAGTQSGTGKSSQELLTDLNKTMDEVKKKLDSGIKVSFWG